MIIMKVNSVHNNLSKFFWPVYKSNIRSLVYKQGQEPEPHVREYFYYIDHQGMLFLEDSKIKNFTSCFKEKKFLNFFFSRIRQNKTGRYEDEFPFISLCGRERNYIKCDDVPIVYTHVINTDKDYLVYGYTDDLRQPFLPETIYMSPVTGRVYHPTDDKFGGIGLVKSKLAIELSKNFEFRNGDAKPPTHFIWKHKTYMIQQGWFQEKINMFNIQVKASCEN